MNVTMPRLSGTTAPTSQTVSLDFRNNQIYGVRITCVFPSPCTTPAPRRGARAWAAPPRFARR